MMKRFFWAVLTAVMLFALCSCESEKIEFYQFGGEFSPFFARTAYDLSVTAQTQETLLVTSGESADIVYDAYTQGLGIADIDVEKTEDKSVCTVSLGKDIRFSDGTPLTAKDVIFSMYVYADVNYTGWSYFGQSDLDGLVNYQYGSDKAEGIVITNEQIENELENPSELTKKYISESIILPVLTEEAQWVKTLYVDPSYKGTEAEKDIETYPEAYKLFEYYYALTDSDLSVKDATDMESMVKLVAQQYGYDYKLLGTVYGSDLSGMAQDCARRALMCEALGVQDAKSGGKIRGIEQIDEYTLKVTINSLSDSQIEDVLGIFVAPFNYYGTGCTDNGDGSFTVDYDSIKEKTGAPVGAGEYVFTNYKEDKYVKFKKNKEYFRQTDLEDTLIFKVTLNTVTPTAHKYFVTEENVTFTENS